MVEKFDDIRTSDVIRDSLPKLLNRDLTALTFSAGTSFPADVTTEMIGRIVNRTDLNALYRLKNVSPIQWELVLDYSSTIPNATTIAETYQPKNSNLTALSALSGSANQVPYFTGATTMSTFPISTLGKSVLNAADAAAVRTLYGLGALAVKDTIATADIQDGAITEAKLAFTPLKNTDGFITGDLRETMDGSSETGWIECTGTIGDEDSEADYADNDAEDLFKVMWALTDIEVLPSKGASAQADWEAHKKITMPDVSPLMENSYIKVKL